MSRPVDETWVLDPLSLRLSVGDAEGPSFAEFWGEGDKARGQLAAQAPAMARILRELLTLHLFPPRSIVARNIMTALRAAGVLP